MPGGADLPQATAPLIKSAELVTANTSDRHNNGYETAYGHMTAYRAWHRRRHARATGQVIGCRLTGLSTGSHLHEILVNGRFVDPMHRCRAAVSSRPDARRLRKNATAASWPASRHALPRERRQLARYAA
jgi:hypothetical protein